MDKEELLGGLMALIVIALVGLVIYGCIKSDEQDMMLLRKYPECITAGKPRVCTQYKQMLAEEE